MDAIFEIFTNFDLNFVCSDKFLAYGMFIFYFVFPFLIFALVHVVLFIFDYSDFIEWKKEQEKKTID